MPRTTMQRLMDMVSPEPMSGCWLWMGSGSSNFDYGRLNIRGRVVHAHRLAWSLFNGEIPSDRQVLHKCDVACCCNPGHLFLGTQLDNVRDMHAKGRQRNQFTDKTHCVNGHEFTGSNLYIHPKRGTRNCRACMTAAQRRYDAKLNRKAG